MTDSYMGHGVKQRDRIRMTHDEIVAFLNERHTATLCTLLPGGGVHAVGMWYAVLDNTIAMESKAKSQKVLNLRRDPRVTVLVETGTRYEELRGVSLRGTARITDDHEYLFRIGVDVFERYQGGYTDELAPIVEAMINKRVAITIDAAHVVSWDHRKLGLATAAGSGDS